MRELCSTARGVMWRLGRAKMGSRGDVEGASDAEAAAVEDVCVDHCCCDAAVAEEFLDGANVVAGFEKVGGE